MNTSMTAPAWHLFVPKLYTVLRRGYSVADFRRDTIAGLTVAIVALPLAMALAIASGAPPQTGVHTAIIAGFLISALGGSRVQVGGPTAAFIPVVFNIINTYGHGGLVLATLMAGLILIVAGLVRLGALMRYMPQPVITGFTAGIAVSIFSSQVKDMLGLTIDSVPAEFIARWQSYFSHLDSFTPASLLLALSCLALIALMRRYRPKWPQFLLAVLFGALVVSTFSLAVPTLGSVYGEIPAGLPSLAWPDMPFARIGELLPSALTIAFLAGVESLLSAVVADGMTGGRHRSNCELVAQGVANMVSALFGGLPATGAIARTATNVRSGGRTPVAGMMHAVFVLLMLLVAAPAMAYVPLAALAAVLLVVAWNMSEIERFRHLMRAPVGDRVVLLMTFALTVMFDLTIAIEVGVVLAAFLFMHRMSQVVAMETDVQLLEEDRDDFTQPASQDQRDLLPEGVAAFRIAGPLFFAVANRLDDVLNQFFTPPKVFILRMRLVPMIDASGVDALCQFVERCARRGTKVILSGTQSQPRATLAAMRFDRQPGFVGYCTDFDSALQAARKQLALMS
ncbi:MAG: sodium-independent anion transporter [Gammaproteobacteria bacterium HGW-Gammaproteobacteria-5]|jgi:SulP family sulfate permease|nr:MAG: sodium-independent anion transporter [Gammaproteobacteria bacterium HGW-Gammaproteobacteria-5]